MDIAFAFGTEDLEKEKSIASSTIVINEFVSGWT